KITIITMNTLSRVPPSFRFHPTDEELVDYYLRKKVASKRIDLDVIRDIDLYKIEPWDLQGIFTILLKWKRDGLFAVCSRSALQLRGKDMSTGNGISATGGVVSNSKG
ncbi:hypothetical protein KI387_010636, partial [Taxus chinensis]